MNQKLKTQTLKNINLQPELENELIKISPLKEVDFEKLFNVASDPLIWEQHPNKNRYKKEMFENYFDGAIKSGGAFLVKDALTDEVIGCSRYYDFIPEGNTISVGYTFLARKYWGTVYNKALKTLMLDYIFDYADKVLFHIGALNIRSQKAIERLGAVKIDEVEMQYYGEDSSKNFIYLIDKKMWGELKSK